MEVYILDSLLRREIVVDEFVSLVWAERFREIGDFELVLHSTPTNRTIFTTGKRLVHNESVRVMTVETVEDTIDSENRRLLKVKGRSLEAILEDRAAMKTTNFITGDEKWHLTGLPKAIAEQMFTDICVTGTLSANDVIPFLGGSALFPADTIAAPTESIDWYQDPASLFNAIKEICDIYDMGLRLVRNPNTGQLQFNIYTGSDRTRQQTSLAPVIFSPELENLQNTTELSTISKTKNCAYVLTEVEGSFYYQLVYDDYVDPNVEGFERHVLMLRVTLEDDEITTIPDSINDALQRRGKDELTKHRSFTAFDGEISRQSQYMYGVHYHLGDLVGMQNSDGLVNNMRVTEQIFSSDAEGDRAYPTLAINTFIEPGSWESWGFEVWEDLGMETWADQP
jgi:hypothetical protein